MLTVLQQFSLSMMSTACANDVQLTHATVHRVRTAQRASVQLPPTFVRVVRATLACIVS